MKQKQKDGNITDRQEILNVCADFYQDSSKSNVSKQI